MVSAQKKIRLIQSDKLEVKRINNVEKRELIGNVILEHNKALLYCDKAYLIPSTSTMEAYDNVKIIQGDSLTITGNYLKYDGFLNTSEIIGDCTLKTKEGVLKTEKITYNTKTGYAYYDKEGVLKTEDVKIKSDKGKYETKNKKIEFIGNVEMTSDDFILTNQKLLYYTDKKKMTYDVFTKILTGEKKIYSKKGIGYNKKKKLSIFNEAKIISDNKIITGDTLNYFSFDSVVKGFGNIKVLDTANNTIINGNKVNVSDKTKKGIITDSSHIIKILNDDSVFIASDSIFIFYDTSNTLKKILLKDKTKSFSKKLSSVCDSILYNFRDSTITMFGKPISWVNSYQIVSKKNIIKLKEEKIDYIIFKNNPILSNEKKKNKYYDQIVGKEMKLIFNEGKINKFDVYNEVLSLYFIRNKKKTIKGQNKILSDTLFADIVNNEISTLRFSKETTGKFIPVQLLNKEDLYIQKFKWYDYIRPKSKKDIFRWNDYKINKWLKLV